MSDSVIMERKNSLTTKPISLDNAVKTDSNSQIKQTEFNGIAHNAMDQAAAISGGVDQKLLAFNQHLQDLGGEELFKKSFILVAHSDSTDEQYWLEKQGSRASFVETGQDGFRYVAVIY